MRIIAGNFKGKKIFFPGDKKTRPLRDMVKESIFNLIERDPIRGSCPGIGRSSDPKAWREKFR